MEKQLTYIDKRNSCDHSNYNDHVLITLIISKHCLGFSTLNRVRDRELSNNCPAKPHLSDFRTPVPGTHML